MRTVGAKPPKRAFHTDSSARPGWTLRGCADWSRRTRPPASASGRWPLYFPLLVAPRLGRSGHGLAYRLALLALEVDEVLQELVGCGDDPGVGLEATLGHDHLGELLAEVDVRHFDRAGGQQAPAVGAGRAQLGQTRVDRLPVERAADLLEAHRVVERGHRDLGQRLVLTVGEHAGDHAG